MLFLTMIEKRSLKLWRSRKTDGGEAASATAFASVVPGTLWMDSPGVRLTESILLSVLNRAAAPLATQKFPSKKASVPCGRLSALYLVRRDL